MELSNLWRVARNVFDVFMVGGGSGLVLGLLAVVTGTVPVTGGSVEGVAFAAGKVLLSGLLGGVLFVVFDLISDRYYHKWLARHQWTFSPGDACDWCGGPPSPSEMLALVGYTKPGETEPRPIEVCRRCAHRFAPWTPEPLDCEAE